MKLADDLNRKEVYRLSDGNSTLDKYRFYKALLLYSELNHSVERYDLVREYFESILGYLEDDNGNTIHCEKGFLIDRNQTMTANAKIELLVCNQTVILMKYLALKTIQNELNQTSHEN